MDRDKKDKLPNMQVGFIDSICMPVYQVRGIINSVCFINSKTICRNGFSIIPFLPYILLLRVTF